MKPLIFFLKEFDARRTRHTSFVFKNGLEHLVPFQHQIWINMDSYIHGLIKRFSDSNIILTGGVDEARHNTENGKLLLQNTNHRRIQRLRTQSYLSDPHKNGQAWISAYLLQQMGFEVEETAYFLVCNADRKADGFNGEMKFQEVLIPYHWNSNWIHGKVTKMINLLNNNNVPDANPSCKNCAYAKQRAAFE